MQEQVLAITKGDEAAPAFRLQMQSIGEDASKNIATLQEQLANLQKQKGKSSIPTSANTASGTDRFVTGRAAANFRKSAADVEAKNQTKIASESKAILDQIKELLAEQTPVNLEVRSAS